jgi:hypothetical protein
VGIRHSATIPILFLKFDSNSRGNYCDITIEELNSARDGVGIDIPAFTGGSKSI